MSLRHLLLPVLLGSQPLMLSAQATVPIGRPNLEYPDAFSRIAGVRELSDGRVIVADSREKTLQLIDLRTGAVEPISREGRGPGEFLSLGGLFPLPDDQTLLADVGNRRYLRIAADGSILETIGLPTVPPPVAGPGERPIPAMLFSMSLLTPRGVDRRGRVYFEPFGLRPDGTPLPDSTAVLRWTRGAARFDTVAWVRRPASDAVWAPADGWQVAPDGRVVRVRPGPYQVLLVDSAGRSSTGPAVPFTPIPIPEAERKERQAQRNAQMSQVMGMAAAEASRAGVSPGPAPRIPDMVFAPAKPPFTGSTAISVAPDGQVWVQRNRPYGDSIPVFDIFDAAGVLQRQVALAKGSRLLGFGRGTVYISRKDEDDLEYLQRYAR